MTHCLNPNCQIPQNPERNIYCQNCGSKLLLKDRYRPLNLIGQGGFGRTFLATDQDKPSKPQCVIKQFFPASQGTNNINKRDLDFANHIKYIHYTHIPHFKHTTSILLLTKKVHYSLYYC